LNHELAFDINPAHFADRTEVAGSIMRHRHHHQAQSALWSCHGLMLTEGDLRVRWLHPAAQKGLWALALVTRSA
jgi:hypothetical protein